MIYRIIAVAIVLASLYGPIAAAQSSQLKQSVEPILCTFTSTDSGTEVNGSTVCSNADAPTINSITQSSLGRPVLFGKLSMMSFQSLRIWVGSQWFTYGISPQLQVSANSWELNLSQAESQLAPADYTVVVELLTDDNYLLRSVYVDAFEVPVIKVTDTVTNVIPGIVTHERQVYENDQPLSGGQSFPFYSQDDKFVGIDPLPREHLAATGLARHNHVKQETQSDFVPKAVLGVGVTVVTGLVLHRIVLTRRNIS